MTKMQLHFKLKDYNEGKISQDDFMDYVDEYCVGCQNSGKPFVSGRSEQLATFMQNRIGKKYGIYFEQQDIDELIDVANGRKHVD